MVGWPHEYPKVEQQTCSNLLADLSQGVNLNDWNDFPTWLVVGASCNF